jgi:hypothetical protein
MVLTSDPLAFMTMMAQSETHALKAIRAPSGDHAGTQ